MVFRKIRPHDSVRAVHCLNKFSVIGTDGLEKHKRFCLLFNSR